MDIYLDHNHWIGLARAYHGKPANDDVAEIARLASEAISASRVRLPVSRIHLLEARKNRDQQRNKRLAEAFVFFSRGWVVRPVEGVIAEELSKWIRGEKVVAACPVRRGLLSAMADYDDFARQLGKTAAEVEAEDRFGDNPEAWMFALSRMQDSAALAAVEGAADRYAKTVESVRSAWVDLPAHQRLAYYAGGVLDDVLHVLRPHSPDVEAAALRLQALPADELVASLSRIPTLDVMIRLGEAKVRDRTRPTDPNDLWDLAFLSLAIPYFDVVVTERSWSHLAASLGLEQRYSCRVLSRLQDLAGVLAGSRDDRQAGTDHRQA